MSMKATWHLVVVLVFVPCLSRAQNEPVTIRLAGDEWFLKSLTDTGMIGGFERQTRIHVDVVFKKDATILSDLDRGARTGDAAYDIIVVRHRLVGALVEKAEVQPIDSLIADPSLRDPNFIPDQQLFTNSWKGLSTYRDHIYGYPFTR